MVVLLMLLNLIFPIVFCLFKCCGKKGIEINHVLLFSFGYLFYWVFPIFVGENALVENREWMIIYRDIPNESIVSYLFAIFIIYLFFIIINCIPLNVKLKSRRFEYSKGIFIVWISVLFAFGALLAFKGRDKLFAGYTVSLQDGSIQAQLSACVLMLFSMYLMYSMKKNDNKIKDSFKNIYVFPVAIMALLLLSMGGRMYIVILLLAFITLVSCFYSPIKYKVFVPLLLCGVLFFGAYGILRWGADISLKGIVNVVSLESVYTAYPLLYFLDNYDLQMFEAPVPLLSGIINLIPSAVFPSKGNYIIGIEEWGYPIYSPLGALNSFVSFQANFGLVGTIVFIICLTVFLRLIKEKADGELSKTMYAMICGAMCFSFFRDPFSTSIIKNMFEFSILIPCIVMYGNAFLSRGRLIKYK